MKILKAGRKVSKKFTCSVCGCVFEAYFGEYHTEELVNSIYSRSFDEDKVIVGLIHTCACPNCGTKCERMEKL